MPLDPTEIVTLSADAIRIGLAIGDAVQSDSPGGKRITAAERTALLADVLALAQSIVREMVD